MNKKKYRINPETLALERIEHGFVYWLRRSGWYILVGICMGVFFFFAFLNGFILGQFPKRCNKSLHVYSSRTTFLLN